MNREVLQEALRLMLQELDAYVVVGDFGGDPQVLDVCASKEEAEQFIAETYPDFYEEPKVRQITHLAKLRQQGYWRFLPGANVQPDETCTLLVIQKV